MGLWTTGSSTSSGTVVFVLLQGTGSLVRKVPVAMLLEGVGSLVEGVTVAMLVEGVGSLVDGVADDMFVVVLKRRNGCEFES